MSDAGLPEAQLVASLSAAGIAVPGETMDRLRIYAGVLHDWQARMNLVGRSTLPDLWTRHFLDSAQLLRFRGASGFWLDMGSGAGFPGLVLAAFGESPVLLVDSIAKKCRFLEAAAKAMGLASQVQVHHGRLEDLSPVSASFITARACAPLAKLLCWGYPFSRETTRWLLLKGQDVAVELAEASKSWKFDLEAHNSLSDTRGSILELVRVRPR